MDSNINGFFETIKKENEHLTEQVTSQEIEIFRLTQKATNLEKALEKQKKFHRKFSDEVETAEKIRNEDFNEAKRYMTERIKLLTQENRQLTKDVSFYKSAYEEVSKEVDVVAKDVEPVACSSQLNQECNSRLSAYISPVSARMTRSAATSMTNATSSLEPNSCASTCNHKSSKVLTKISEKLLLENKKLKAKLINLNATIRDRKAKNQQLENFQKKINNKKLIFSKDSDELAKLIESTTTTNEITFNAKVLAKLGELSEYKVELLIECK